MPGLNLSLGSTDLETWRSGIWTCENGHMTESSEEPDQLCDHYEEGACGEWDECVLASCYPREGEWGIIECGRCGNEFIERNSERVTGWHCNDCGDNIVPRSKRVRFPNSGDSIETEQSSLPIAATDGGRTLHTETERQGVE